MIMERDNLHSAMKSSKRHGPATMDATSPRMSKRARLLQTKSLLSSANALSRVEFESRYMPGTRYITAKDGKTYVWALHRASDLSKDSFEACYNLIEETSGDDYRNASQGWNPEYKREEMKEKDMFYLLVRWSSQPMSDADEGLEQDDQAERDGEILAFTSFMLTPENGIPVVYVYEIHLKPKLQGSGFGKALMSIVETTGKQAGVVRSMLTVFTANARAEAFYRRLGYEIDASSPKDRELRGGRIKRPEYLILSKRLD